MDLLSLHAAWIFEKALKIELLLLLHIAYLYYFILGAVELGWRFAWFFERYE